MRLISWNVNRRRDLQRLTATLGERRPGLVALQEFNIHGFAKAADTFAVLGLPYVMTNEQHALTGGRRNYGLLIASRWSLAAITDPACVVPWPETFLSARVDAPFGGLEVHTTHIPPGSSHGRVKVETMQGIYNRLACASGLPRILCGDFNTPQLEQVDGTVLTWGQTATGALRRDRPGWTPSSAALSLAWPPTIYQMCFGTCTATAWRPGVGLRGAKARRGRAISIMSLPHAGSARKSAVTWMAGAGAD